MCPVVSGTMTADPSSRAGCEARPSWIGFVGPAHPKDYQLDLDVEK